MTDGRSIIILNKNCRSPKMGRIVKKHFERKNEIIQTARNLIETEDYESMTLQDVMNQLKIAKGTIYHYFKSKEELLEAVVEMIVDEHLKTIETVIEKAQGNALERLEAIIQQSQKANSSPILQELHKKGNEALHLRLLAKALSNQAPLYAKLIEQGCTEGIFHTEHPLECAEFILSAIQFLTDVGIYPWKQEELIRRKQAIPRLIEQQLGATIGSFNFYEKKNGT